MQKKHLNLGQDAVKVAGNSKNNPPRSPMASISLWLTPVVVAAIVMGALAAAYLGGNINSTKHLSKFPLAVVNLDQGARLPDGSQLKAGADITSGLKRGLDSQKFSVEALTQNEARRQIEEGRLYGMVLLPRDLSSDLVSWGTGALKSGTIDRPTVEVLTNTRAGSAAANIAATTAESALAKANIQLGDHLTSLVQKQAAAAGASEPSATAAAALANPMEVQTRAFAPLPEGTGSGLSAFYYALMLTLAGFTGSMIVSSLVDSRLGFIPTEFGPLYRLAENAGVSRRATLLAKWGIMALVSLAVSAVYIGVASVLGMPIDSPWTLWLFGCAMIFGIAVVVQTIQALLGNSGMIVSLFIFVILALPSAGGTLPLEAVPSFFRWLGSFEPMHQIYLGSRAVLYFDGNGDAGLTRAFTAAGLAAVCGIAVGLAGVTLYDRRGLHRNQG
ncbi:YhgE/Pip domain-containing protein [Streptomyces sp. NBC_01594]|uniref:YhgE/Pip domain-containing protein n=1 Tax=Streptomyces sp. NBC_01594 TaxID=2975890 RepID=UPI00386E02E7